MPSPGCSVRLFSEMQKYADELRSFENELRNYQDVEKHSDNFGELPVMVQSQHDEDVIKFANQQLAFEEMRGSTFMDS